MQRLIRRNAIRRASSLGILLVLAAPVPAATAPTPVPGGANQISALSGHVGQPLFNGVLRVTVQSIQDGTPQDTYEKNFASTASKKYIDMKVLLNNGWHDTFRYGINYTLADADSVTEKVGDTYKTPASLGIEQGAAARQTIHAPVDKDFKPTKLLIECGSCPDTMHFRALRISIP